MASISKRESGAWQNTSYDIRATATDTITALPTTIYGDGTNATISIKGNTVQSGTPTPENPIMPQGCGNKTANFCSLTEGYLILINNVRFTVTNGLLTINGTANGSGGRVNKLSPVFTLPAGTYYISFTNQVADFTAYVNKNSDNTVIGYSSVGNFTLAEDTEVYIGCNVVSGKEYDVTIGIMLNTGSTALPYEPYGYKIPILSADTTTNNYLGEVETTRKIRKLVLDGTETITEESTNVYSIPITDTVTTGTGLSTHFEYDSTVSVGQFRIEAGKAVFGYNDTLANFSTFLAAQYAAGTPVCVWYVLAEPETGIVNEPLMKIEDYADEVNNISIPTTDGANTLSVDTTVQPSEVSVNYHGWHMGTVHERTAGQWD